jgi:3-dehydroquinate synthase
VSLITRHRLGSYPLNFCNRATVLQGLPEPHLVVTDRHVAALAPLPDAIVLPAGERTKSFRAYQKLIAEIAGRGVGRNITLVAFGGGVIGDLVGFAAATYLRGVGYVQIPTTLLAQVDSSVGGKVGIDLPEGKNLLGAFYPPQEVRLCLDFLSTLPKRQVANGMAEVLKYGFIQNPAILDLATNGPSKQLVEACLQCKIEVVEADELETTGLRAILNFGHTVAHALEAELNYRGLLHGEAVSVGMVAEAHLGERLGLTKPGTANQVASALAKWRLPVRHALLSAPERLIPWMRRDKKRTGGGLSFSLLESVGSCRLVRDVPEAAVGAALQEVGGIK